MASARVVAVAFLLLTVPASLVVGSSGSDDASSGTDAPDRYDRALGLETVGTYSGELSPDGDADWYKLSGVNVSISDTEACATVTVTGDHGLAEVNVTVEGSGNVSAEDTFNPDIDPEFGLASGAYDRAVIGLRPFDGDDSTGPYDLTVDVLELDELDGDGSSGSDAPALDSSGDPVTIPGACFGGELADGDTSDAYAIEASQGQAFAFNLAGKGSEVLDVTLVDPDGVEHGPFSGDDGSTVHRVSVDTTGTWTFEAAGPGDKSIPYIVGLSLIDDPEEEEDERNCQPYCFMTG